MLLKEGWNSSNHNLNYMPQVITFQRRIVWIENRQVNLQALDLFGPICVRSSSGLNWRYAWRSRITLVLVYESIRLCETVSEVRSLEWFRTQDTRHCTAWSRFGEPHCCLQSLRFRCWSTCPPVCPVICEDWIHGTPKRLWLQASERYDQRLQSISCQYTRCHAPHGNILQYAVVYKVKSHNKTYIPDEHLHVMELLMYHGITVQVKGVEGERISEMCRCTGRQCWFGGDQPNDWVWVKQLPGMCYSALTGCLPW
jgi:hypothetical protein